jgi:NADH:ubiquinone oxidoreductase subunit C
LDHLGSIGSKAVKIKPRKDIKKKGRKDEYTTACIYVSGKQENFQKFLDAINKDALTKGQQNDFITLESISILEVSDKVKSINNHEMMNIEVALHTPENTSSVIDTFELFALQNGAIIDTAEHKS